MNLNVIATLAETEKKNRESKYFETKRLEKEANNEKVSAALLSQEASNHVAMYRRIRNIFQAYRNSCSMAISVCQSSLKSFEREKSLPH